jgi:hypothetical protein
VDGDLLRGGGESWPEARCWTFVRSVSPAWVRRQRWVRGPEVYDGVWASARSAAAMPVSLAASTRQRNHCPNDGAASTTPPPTKYASDGCARACTSSTSTVPTYRGISPDLQRLSTAYSWHLSSVALGVPRLERAAIAVAEGLVDQIVPTDDHALLLGRIVGGRHTEGEPLLYHRRRYASWLDTSATLTSPSGATA